MLRLRCPWRDCCVTLSDSPAAATDLDLISFLRVIPAIRRRRGIRIPAWYFLLVAALIASISIPKIETTACGRTYRLSGKRLGGASMNPEINEAHMQQLSADHFRQNEVEGVFCSGEAEVFAQAKNGSTCERCRSFNFHGISGDVS